MATTLASQVQELYVGYLGRAADKAGLDFWVKAIESGTSTLESVALGFTLSEEYKAQYNGLTTTQLVAKVYQNVLGRAADADGLAFWAGEVNKGVIKADTLVKTMIGSLGAIDQLTIDNKVAAANAYTVAAGDKYSVEAGKAAVVNAGTTVPGTSTPGQTFTLTASTNVITGGADLVNGTAGNDTIRAAAADSLDVTDVVDGGAGFDTLTVGAGGWNATDAPVIRNVERIDNGHGLAETLAFTNVTGLEQLWTTGANTGVYTDSKLTTTFGFSGAAARSAQLDFTNTNLAGASTLKLATTMTAGNTATVTFGAGDAALIENLTVDATGNSVIALANALTTLETVKVTGSGVVSLTGTNATTVTSVDASANTGGVTFTSGALAAPATVKGGSGNDTLDLALATTAGRLTVEAGDGNDIITGGLGRDTINAGAGNDVINTAAGDAAGDTITLGAGNDVVVYSAIAQSQFAAGGTNTTRDVITDFKTSGTDTISFTALAGTQVLNTAPNLITIQNAVNALAPTATLADALGTIVAGNSAVDTVSYFQFQGNTYIVVEDGATAGFAAGDDMVIELTGLVSLAATDFALG